MQQFLFWRQDLTGFHKYRHLRPYSSLGNCVEQQALGKNLSGLIIRKLLRPMQLGSMIPRCYGLVNGTSVLVSLAWTSHLKN